MECGNYQDRTPRHRIRSSPRMVEKTAKAQVQEVLEKLPETASFEEIRYHIDIRQTIHQGWDARRMITLEEIPRRLANWLTRWTEAVECMARDSPMPKA